MRLATGLVIAAYVLGHFLNHALGIVSLGAMDAARGVLAAGWRSLPGTALLYGALLAHFALALASLGRRRTLRMPAWEAAQIALGLAVPPLLIAHVVETRFAWQLFERPVGYERIVWALWADPWNVAKQTLLVVVVWLHLCFGIHFWLRLRAWYPRAQPLLLALAVLVPALALAGFYSAGFHLAAAVEKAGGPTSHFPHFATPERRAALAALRDGLLWGFWLLLGAALAARLARRVRRSVYRIHLDSGRPIRAAAGTTILEALREAGVPHTSVCGGRARCTTCRVRVARGREALPAPGALEAEALARIDAEPNVRLACQTRPSADVWIAPLVPASTNPALARRPGALRGRERQVAAMFVDLRDSTALGETRLPYDVVFILNQFFAEMSEALERTGGHYAQFHGDGLLALYGLRSEIGAACRKALRGAADMQRRIEQLNARLAPELDAPLRIGIGLHAGTAIVGTMGPPSAPIVSAIGDAINAAARLEGLSKRYGCTLVVSAEVLRLAGVEPGDLPLQHARLRGKTQRIEVYTVRDLARLTSSVPT